MSSHAGKYRLGPEKATLSLRTKRTGAAAKAGHDLLMHVTSWGATLEIGEDPAESSLALDVDATSLRVQEGHGGAQALGDADKASIHESIDEDVLRRQDIMLRSTKVESEGGSGRLSVQGDLTIVGETHPITFDLEIADDGTLGAGAVVTQSAWGMKPYSILFGALKVADDVEVGLEGRL